MAVGDILIRSVTGDRPYQPAKEGDVIINPGTINGNIQTQTANYSAELADDIILVDETGGAVTITLPTPSYEGEAYTIKQITAGANNTTIATEGSETIDGASTQSITAQWDFYKVVSDGDDWFIIGN